MVIGELAQRTGVSAEAIRYYERSGVLPAPTRTSGRYRRYTEADVARVSLVRRARRLGFPLTVVRELLEAAGAEGSSSCERIDRLARRQLQTVETKLNELVELRTDLMRITATCRRVGPVAECRILGALREG